MHMRHATRFSLAAIAALTALACSEPTAPSTSSASFTQVAKPGGTTELPGTIASCGDEITALHGAIAGATTFANERDQTNLLLKTVDAANKINDGKFADALQKLEDIGAALDSWAAGVGTRKAKIGADDFNAISSALVAAEACVAGLL